MSAGYKTFTVCHDWSGWEATLRIQQDSETLDTLREMLLFRSGGQEMIEDCEGDVQEAWLLLFAQTAIIESIEWNVHGVRSQFQQREGWVPLDGTCGIELTGCDEMTFESEDFTVKVNESKEATSC